MESFENILQKPSYRESAPEVWSRLESFPRTGWVIRNIENPETVAEHSEDMITRFGPLLKDFEELDDNDREIILAMFEVHDWAESDPKVGDIPPRHVGYEAHHQVTPEEKSEIEEEAMRKICANIENGKEIFAIWKECEDGQTIRVQVAKQLDKAHAIVKAIHYEIEQSKPGLAWEFYTYGIKSINHPIIKKYLAEQMSTNLIEQG